MRLEFFSLAAALLLSVTHATGTEEAKGGCNPVTVTVKEWEDVEPKTVYVTVTNVVEKWKTDYVTVTNVVEKWKTDYVTITTTDVQIKPTTIINTVEVTVTETRINTEVDTVTVTDVETDVSVVTTTVVDTDVTTVVEPGTTVTVDGPTVTVTDLETDISVVTTTVVDTDTTTVVSNGPTVTVSDCPTSASLTGLVLCPTRDVNPTYTPSKPLPTDYLWGCPPGKICTPPQVDCNFERNPPSDRYVCAPEECKPVPEIPDYVNLEWPSPTEDDCAWRGPALGFFNLDPTGFGLTYAIFDVFGQPVCEAEDHHGWSDSKPPKGKSGKTRRARRTNNPIARLLHRQVNQAPAECYGVFDSANDPPPPVNSTQRHLSAHSIHKYMLTKTTIIAQGAGLRESVLCQEPGAFYDAIKACEDCAADADWTGEVREYDTLQDFLSWCDDQ